MLSGGCSREVVVALSDVSFRLIGGVASAAYGRPRGPRTSTSSARRGRRRRPRPLAARGFEVERTNPMWIYKAFREGVQIDVIFKVRSEVYFDEAMAERIRPSRSTASSCQCSRPRTSW